MNRLCWWSVVCWVFILGSASADTRLAMDAQTDLKNAPKLPYAVRFEGLDHHKDLRDDLASASRGIQFQSSPPATYNQLLFRAREDLPRLQAVLRNAGYYQARLNHRIEQAPPGHVIVFEIDSGALFRIGQVTVQLVPASLTSELPAISPKTLELAEGMPAQAGRILKAPRLVEAAIRRLGYPLVRSEKPRITVDHATHRVAVVLPVRPGPLASFGKHTIEGLNTVNAEVLERKIPWRVGERFDPVLLTKAQDDIAKTKLFRVVRVIPGDELDSQKRLPVTIQVLERRHRTFRAGVGYHSDEGAGAKAGWEHRNIARRADRIKLSANMAEMGYALEGYFEHPDFLIDALSVGFKSRLAEEYTEAYDSRSLENALTFKYDFSEKLYATVGMELVFSEIDQLGEVQSHSLIGFPLTAHWDKSSDLLDPVHGFRVNGLVAPYLDVQQETLSFLKLQGELRWYLPIAKSPRTILAFKAGGGAILCDSFDTVPADFRFYAGGGGSVRGYGYQLLGPMAGEDPTGGKALLELSAELRVRITPNLGLVGFVDTGNAFSDTLPDIREQLYNGGGLGLRYYTPIGPLRLDVAVPFERRGGLDDAFQYYISIGQSF